MEPAIFEEQIDEASSARSQAGSWSRGEAEWVKIQDGSRIDCYDLGILLELVAKTD